MLDRFVTAVSDWPVVLQGALGSALFATLLFGGQRATAALSGWMRSRSKLSRQEYLFELLLRLEAVSSTESVDTAKYAAVLVYRAMRHLMKALIWLTLGLAMGSVISVLGIVGFAGCLFYLFKSLNVLAPTELTPDVAQKVAEARAELEQLEKA